MMANERITENIVREHLKDLGYYDCEETTVEEQKSQIYEIKKLLKGASKTGKGGSGAPEFIVTSSKAPDFIIIFECKAENKHQ